MTGADKFRKVMREFSKGELTHGTTGDKVTDRSQALAIAYSEAREVEPSYGMYKDGGGVEVEEEYYIFEGVDHYKNKPIYQVVGRENDYVGEWHDKRKDAEKELKELSSEYAKGGEIALVRKIQKECDADGKICEHKFRDLIGDENPSRISTVDFQGMKFEKCLFSPHYKWTNQSAVEQYGLGGTVKRTVKFARLSGDKKKLQKQLNTIRKQESKLNDEKKTVSEKLDKTNKELKRLGV